MAPCGKIGSVDFSVLEPPLSALVSAPLGFAAPSLSSRPPEKYGRRSYVWITRDRPCPDHGVLPLISISSPDSNLHTRKCVLFTYESVQLRCVVVIKKKTRFTLPAMRINLKQFPAPFSRTIEPDWERRLSLEIGSCHVSVLKIMLSGIRCPIAGLCVEKSVLVGDRRTTREPKSSANETHDSAITFRQPKRKINLVETTFAQKNIKIKKNEKMWIKKKKRKKEKKSTRKKNKICTRSQ